MWRYSTGASRARRRPRSSRSAFSALYCLLVIRRIELLRLSREDFAPDFAIARRLLTLGAPMALQNGIIAVGGLVVQYVINGFGFIVIAGLTATNKIFGLLELAAISYGFSMSTYAGQNLGAGKVDRIRRGMRAALLMAVATSAVISILMLVFGRSILSLFVSGEPDVVQQVLDVAYAYLSILAYMLCILYFLHIYRSALQGMGDTVRPMISGVMELAMRILVVMTLPKVLGRTRHLPGRARGLAGRGRAAHPQLLPAAAPAEAAPGAQRPAARIPGRIRLQLTRCAPPKENRRRAFF